MVDLHNPSLQDACLRVEAHGKSHFSNSPGPGGSNQERPPFAAE
jgi:hypothetical protein